MKKDDMTTYLLKCIYQTQVTPYICNEWYVSTTNPQFVDSFVSELEIINIKPLDFHLNRKKK